MRKVQDKMLVEVQVWCRGCKGGARVVQVVQGGCRGGAGRVQATCTVCTSISKHKIRCREVQGVKAHLRSASDDGLRRTHKKE